MNYFRMAWMIAGFASGWILIEYFSVILKLKCPSLFNFACGCIGVLIAYTLLR